MGLLALFITTFITSFVRAKLGTSRPSVNTATSLVHILLFVTITQLANEDALEYLPYKLNRIVFVLFGGTLLSCLGCYLIFPFTASTKLKKNINHSFTVLGGQIDILSDILQVQSTPRNTIVIQMDHEKAFSTLQKESTKLLADIYSMNSESLFEFWTTLFMHRDKFQKIIVRVERCFQFSSAVKHSATLLYILPVHEKFVTLCSIILQKCNNAVTVLSYGTYIVSYYCLTFRC